MIFEFFDIQQHNTHTMSVHSCPFSPALLQTDEKKPIHNIHVQTITLVHNQAETSNGDVQPNAFNSGTAYTAIRLSTAAQIPNPAVANAPKKQIVLNTFTYQTLEKYPRTNRFHPRSNSVTWPVAGSNPSPGWRAYFFTLYPMCSSGGKVQENCKMQVADTMPVKPEKSGMAAPMIKAMDQQMGIRAIQNNLPDRMVRGGALNKSTKTFWQAARAQSQIR